MSVRLSHSRDFDFIEAASPDNGWSRAIFSRSGKVCATMAGGMHR
jgi:hypothetical protein